MTPLRLLVDPESAIRRGLAMQQNGGLSLRATARSIGMAYETYGKARYLVMLLDGDRSILSEDEAKRVEAAVTAMNDSRLSARPIASVVDIIDRVYGSPAVRFHRDPGRVTIRRLAAWDAYFGALTEVCSHAHEIIIPAFTAVQAASVMAELKAATAQIDRLRREIRRVSP